MPPEHSLVRAKVAACTSRPVTLCRLRWPVLLSTLFHSAVRCLWVHWSVSSQPESALSASRAGVARLAGSPVGRTLPRAWSPVGSVSLLDISVSLPLPSSLKSVQTWFIKSVHAAEERLTPPQCRSPCGSCSPGKVVRRPQVVMGWGKSCRAQEKWPKFIVQRREVWPKVRQDLESNCMCT